MNNPEAFGCGDKLPFPETLRLHSILSQSVLGDAQTINDSNYFHSIDKVSECSNDSDLFAQLAIRHCINDLYASGASPCFISFCFEFNRSTDTEQRLAISNSFFSRSRQQLLSVGKCHSVLQDSTTSVVVSVVGRGSSFEETVTQWPGRGKLFLTKRLGYSKLLYLKEQRDSSGHELAEFMGGQLDPVPTLAHVRAMTDVSGFGLAGAAITLANRTSSDLLLCLDPTILAAPRAWDTPEPCLQNWIGDYQCDRAKIDEESWRIAGLRETCGPFLCMVEDEQLHENHALYSDWIIIGEYSRGLGFTTIEMK